MLEVNNIKNSLVLKENELVHFQEAMTAQIARANSTIKELLVEREEKDKLFEELTNATETLKADNEKLRKLMDERVREKATQVAKL